MLTIPFAIQHLWSFLGKVISSSNKKRPNNIVFSRTFDGAILDMFEANIVSFSGDAVKALGVFDLTAIPVFMCFGDVFETDPLMGRVRNYFADLFSPYRNEKVLLNVNFGLQMVITLNGFEDKTLVLNVFKFDRQEAKLKDLGIKLVLKVGRAKMAEDDKWKEACKQPRLERPKREKRYKEVNALGETMGRVFVKQQDLKTLRLKKIKKRTGKEKETKDEQPKEKTE